MFRNYCETNLIITVEYFLDNSVAIKSDMAPDRIADVVDFGTFYAPVVKISIQISMRSKLGFKFRYSEMDSQLQYLVVQNLWTKCDIERYFETLANCKLKETLI